MALQNTVLRPGELAVYIDSGNGTVELERLLAFLKCFQWIGDDGVLPAYDLDVLDLQKKCIFARFGLRWRGGAEPDEARLDQMQAQIDKMRKVVSDTDRRMADAAEAQVEIARLTYTATVKGMIAATALGAAGLVVDIYHDVRSETPTACATAVADLMEKDDVSSIKIWSPDCTAIITRDSVPELRRREEQGGQSSLDLSGNASGSVATGNAGPRGIARQRFIDQPATPTAGTAFIGVHSANHVQTATSPDITPGTPLGVQQARRIAALKADVVERTGTLTIGERLLALNPINGAHGGRPILIVPPNSYTAIDGDVATVRGQFFALDGPQDMMIADVIVPLSRRPAE